MSFILKNIRTVIPTTTLTTTTTTSTTTTTLNVVNISDNDVYIGGFPATDITGVGAPPNYLYNPNSPMFVEYSKAAGGTLGDIDFSVTVNNTTITDNTDGTYNLDVDVTLVYTNTNVSEPRKIELPRLAIDLPISTLKGVNSTFAPNSSVSSLRAYTNSRVVVEFASVEIPAGDIRSFQAQGTAVLNTTSLADQDIVNIVGESFNNGTNQFEFRVSRTAAPASSVDVPVKFAYRNDITNENGITIAASNTSVLYSYSPTFGAAGYGSGVIRVDDTNIPEYLVNSSNPTGYAEIASMVTTSTTSTTTTLAPLASLRFRTGSFPATSPVGGTVDTSDPLQYVIEYNSGNFDPVPYRVEISSPVPFKVGIGNVVGNSGGGAGPNYFDGDIVEAGTLLSGVFSTVTAEFINIDTSDEAMSIQLFVDAQNNGVYVLQDTLSFTVNAIGGPTP